MRLIVRLLVALRLLVVSESKLRLYRSLAYGLVAASGIVLHIDVRITILLNGISILCSKFGRVVGGYLAVRRW